VSFRLKLLQQGDFWSRMSRGSVATRLKTGPYYKLPAACLHAGEIIMAALRSRCGHYILVLFLLSRLILAVAEWMSTILPHMVWP